MMWIVSSGRTVARCEHITNCILLDGEFHVDLYTLPDALIKMLWDFVSGKVDMATL